MFLKQSNIHFLQALALMFVFACGIPMASAETQVQQGAVLQLAQSQQVNLNKASAEELSSKLTGIGESRAQAIVAYRDKVGAFKTPEDLLEVKGVGLKTLEKNRSRMTF